jgi:hypothetical protein
MRTSQPVVGRHSPVFDRRILYLMYSSGAAVVDSAALSHIVWTIRRRNLRQVTMAVRKLMLCYTSILCGLSIYVKLDRLNV